VETSGVEWRVEWSAEEWSGVEWSWLELRELDRTGLEQTTGADWTVPVKVTPPGLLLTTERRQRGSLSAPPGKIRGGK